LKAVVLRKLGRKDEAHAWIKASYGIDTFNYVCMMEEHLLTGDNEPLERMISLMHNSSDNYDETALEYCAAGLHEEAMTVWQVAVEQNATSPMTYYYMGRYAEAEQADSAYCFPNRLEAVLALEKAKEASPHGAKAPYYLGCLYYDKRQYDAAIENWELSAKLDPCFPSVWRNLALARFNKQNRQEEALACMEKAFHLDETDARTLMELDQLYKRLHKPHQQRLDFLRKYPLLVLQRGDLVLEEATLLNQLGRFEEAKTIIDNRIFHPWEGGEGKVSGQYQFCRVEIAKKLLKKDPQSAEAKRLLEECLVFPQSLGEGKLYGAQDNDFLYFLGRYEEGTAGPTEPAAAMYYNDAKPDKIFYAGLCYRKLGQEDKARGLFNKLINYGKQNIYDKVVMDYFAVSLPDLLIWEDSLDTKNRIHCLYMLALGYFGMGDKDKALKYLSEVETLDNNHQGAQQLRTMMG
jgi:tetratricopeptide (TPR) repeat protein